MIDQQREDWLHGWPRTGNTEVLIGTGVHCVGCGKHRGTVTIVIPHGYMPPECDPEWPFNERNCPVCITRDRFEKEIEKAFGTWPPTAVELYKNLENHKRLSDSLRYALRVWEDEARKLGYNGPIAE